MNNFEIKYFENEAVGTQIIEDSGYRVYYCQRGKLSAQANGEQSFMLHGDVFIAPPGTRHTICVVMPYTVYFAISFDEGFIDDDFTRLLLDNRAARNKLILPSDEIVFFEASVYKIFDEYTNPKDYHREIISNAFQCLWTILHRLYVRIAQSSLNPKNEDFIKYCHAYTDTHCCDNLTLSDMIRLSSMSRSVFCELFKKETGLSFNAYLNRKRIQKAISYMKEGKKITEIAYMCGYAEQSTFYRNFVKFTGTSPAEFQAKLLKQVPLSHL